VRKLLALLRTPAWLATLAGIPGYEAHRSGEVLPLNKVLPWWSYRTPKASK
jgi:putative molybdopterin biosynthesis protein